MTPEFPVFDLAAFGASTAHEKPRLAAKLDQICRHTGFLAVGNHNVPSAIVDDIWTATQAFFAQTPAQKQKSRAPFEGCKRRPT
jgi:isopenicillin N synthase-like dioxygenase